MHSLLTASLEAWQSRNQMGLLLPDKGQRGCAVVCMAALCSLAGSMQARLQTQLNKLSRAGFDPLGSSSLPLHGEQDCSVIPNCLPTSLKKNLTNKLLYNWTHGS